MAIDGEHHPVVITSFAMQPASNVATPWDEDKIAAKLKECDAILFAAYRASTKLAIVQEALNLDLVNLNVVINLFQHRSNDVILADVYNAAASKARHHYYNTALDVEAYSRAASKMVESIYGDDKTGQSLRTFLTVLCDGKLRDKLTLLFRQFAHGNSDRCLRREDLRSLLVHLARFPEFFGESRSFGLDWVESAVDSCFTFTGIEAKAINEDVFLRWQLMEPQILVWLPTFYRQTSAKGIRHGIRCSNCRTRDIVGMRYQCLRCLNYDLCQRCFFFGNISRHHKIQHPMQEYCYKSSRKDATLAFLKTLANNLRKRNSRDVRGRYLLPPYRPPDSPFPSSPRLESGHSSGFHSETDSSESTVIRRSDQHDGGIVISRQRRNEVRSIIMNLEANNENRRIHDDDTVLVKANIRDQLNRLKTIMDAVFGSSSVEATVIGSTPLSYSGRKHCSFDLSPISSDPNRSLSEVSMADITSFLAKTGNDPKEGKIQGLDVTRRLRNDDDEEEEEGDEDVLNELESLMNRLENVFRSFQDPSYLASNSCTKIRKGIPFEMDQLVSEIGDQIHAFTTTTK